MTATKTTTRKKLKNVYMVMYIGGFGIAAQPMKGNTPEQALERFNKRFPKIEDAYASEYQTEDKFFIRQAI